jgi:hypothetical protein
MRASATPNHAARSISENVCSRPERGGHSNSNALLRRSVGFQSPSIAQTCTNLPPGCLAVPNGMESPVGRCPVSSANSRWAASSGVSPGAIRPFGMDHAPKGAARMPKQDFKATALLTEEQEAGTLLRCEALGRQ